MSPQALVVRARRRLASTQAAEDAVSEAFARAIERIDGFVWTAAGFEAWMYGIVRNVVHEVHRGHARDLRLERKQAGTVGDLPTVPDEIGDGVESAEERGLLRRAFATLSESDRELLELRVIGGLTADEVAVVLDKNPGAIRMAQSRALERLRDAMKEAQDA